MKRNIGIMVPGLNSGGAERAAANLSRDLSDMYNVYLLLFNTKNIVYPYQGEIINLHFKAGVSIFQRGLRAAELIYNIKRSKKKYHLDVVISFMPGANKYNVIAKSECRTIISIRNTMSQKGLSNRERRTIIKTGKKADMTISLSEGARKDLIQNFEYDPDKVKTIYNSCDAKWFIKESAEVDQLIDKFDFLKPTIVTVGRLHEQKGQWHLIRAFALIKEKIKDAQLVIFGEGPLESQLKDYAQHLHIEEDVHFLGYVSNHHKFMAMCDVFAFPSLYEGLGNVLLEALACEMPIVSTDCLCGPREILCPEKEGDIDDIYYGQYGMLIPPFVKKQEFSASCDIETDEIRLANAILMVLSDKTLRQHYREKAKERSLYFLPQNIKHVWYDEIEKVIQEKQK